MIKLAKSSMIRIFGRNPDDKTSRLPEENINNSSDERLKNPYLVKAQ